MTTIRAISRVVPDVVVDSECVEALVYGSNILTDPGFESQGSGLFPILDDLSGWPFHAEEPDGTPVAFTEKWAQNAHTFNPPINPGWEVKDWNLSTANPRNGSNHARIEALDGDTDQNYLIPTEAGVCVENEIGGVASCRVAPGDTLDLSMWIMRTGSLEVGDSIWPYIWGRFFTDDGTDLNDSTFLDGNFDSGTTVGTSYQESTFQIVAPATAYWAVIYCGFDLDTSTDNTFTIDVDDITVGLTAA